MSDLLIALQLAWRGRIFAQAGWLLLGLAGVVLLAAGFSARQPATVALDTGLSYVRFVVPLVVILLSQELIGREFERRLVLTSLTYPRPRYAWLLGRFGGITIIALLLLSAAALMLLALVTLVMGWYPQATAVGLGLHLLATIFLVALDVIVTSAFVLLVSIVARTPAFVLIASVGFLVIARSYSGVIDLLRQGTDSFVERMGGAALYRDSLPTLNFLVPDLGALDIRAAALYGQFDFVSPDIHWHILGSLAYAGALVAFAIWLINRRTFE